MKHLAVAGIFLALASSGVSAQVNAGEQKSDSNLPFAVTQVRQVEGTMQARETELTIRSRELERLTQRHQQEENELRQKASQVLEMQTRLTADRQALREREEKQVQLEQAREGERRRHLRAVEGREPLLGTERERRQSLLRQALRRRQELTVTVHATEA